jgi:hypothetical protein
MSLEEIFLRLTTDDEALPDEQPEQTAQEDEPTE